MNTTTAYTPLECLLLFQSLVAYGTEDESFVQISDLLTNNALVKSGETFDDTRLSADALRELYLELLREELRSEEDGPNDGVQPGSKKRKIQSPILPTVKDAQEHKEKLPMLVERLYARYKDYMTKAIREDERQYAEIRREITEIEKGEWDERILKEDRALANKNGSLSPGTSRPKINGASLAVPPQEKLEAVVPKIQEQSAARKATPPPILPPKAVPLQAEVRPEGLATNDALNKKEKTPVPSPKPVQVSVAAPQVPASNPPKPKQILPPAPSPTHPIQQPPQQPGIPLTWQTPYQAGPLHQPMYPLPPGSYPPGPYPQHGGPYPLQGLAPPPGFQHPHQFPPPPQHLPSSPLNPQHQHPAILPPSARRSPSLPGTPLGALADVAGQQNRPPSGSSMMQQPPILPPGYAQQYPPQRLPPANGPPQWNQQPMQQQYQGGPPPQYFHQPQNQPPLPGPSAPLASTPRQYTSPYNVNQGQRPQPQLASQNQTPRPISSQPNTPMSKGLPRLITGTGTKWTPTLSALTPKSIPAKIESPAFEPLSPVLRPIKTSSAKKPTKQVPKPEPVKPTQAPKRGVHRTRAGSTASSVLAGSRRSMSIMSHADDHADELSLDNNVKEEVNTPLSLGGEDETGDTTADDASLPPSQRQFSRPKNPASSPSRLKRKRDSVPSTPRESREPSGPPTHVLWTRNFPKISVSALESISGHRNASIFAAPIKERDAPGYKHLILRPQDLKSIKSAILAGQRAAAEKEKQMGENMKAESSILLPISEDLIPPKGIINASQLEKELMRMFANAVMFNADPDRGFGSRMGSRKGKKGGEGYEIDEDSIIKDTKSMFADVERIVQGLRSAEAPISGVGFGMGVGGRGSSVGRGSRRGSSIVNTEDDEEDELAGDGGVKEVPAKRRRRG